MAPEALGRTVALIAERCRAAGSTVATAESCTGGLVADALTDIAGASDWYRGGFVSYADDAKSALLGIPSALIAAHGAVSEAVALAMATGARERLGADVAVAVTGIAGPGGGSPTKPVGLVWIACATPRGAVAERHRWEGDRRANKLASAAAALALLLRSLEEPA